MKETKNNKIILTSGKYSINNIEGRWWEVRFPRVSILEYTFEGFWEVWLDRVYVESDYPDQSLDEVKENIESNFENFVQIFQHFGDPFKIYRTMDIENVEKWIEELKKGEKTVGVYWSWDEQSAYDFGVNQNFKNMIIITGIVEMKSVDWINTIMLHMDYEMGDEKEIRIYKGENLTLHKIETDSKKIKLDLPIFS